MTPGFLSMAGEGNKVYLSDLKVTGYIKDVDGCWHGDFRMEIRDGAGACVLVDPSTGEIVPYGTEDALPMCYYWVDCDGYETGWHDEKEVPLNGESPLGVPSEIAFNPGDSFWAFGSDNADVKLVYSGAVNKNSEYVQALGGGAGLAWGNPFPAPLKLSTMYVDGYVKDVTGCWHGDFRMEVLDGAGACVLVDPSTGEIVPYGTEDALPMCYYWVDCDGYAAGAGWYDEKEVPVNGESPLGDAADIIVEPGQGFWVFGSDNADVNLNVPVPYSL